MRDEKIYELIGLNGEWLKNEKTGSGSDIDIMKKKSPKTNAVRLLEKMGITYELREYEVDEDDLSGEYVARKIGLSPEKVFKTLVVRGDKIGVFLACIPSCRELDIKELAKLTGNKRADLVPVKDIMALTGYVRGGVSPVAAKKQYRVFIDSSASAQPFVSLSAGIRGVQMLINPDDLGKVVNVSWGKIAR